MITETIKVKKNNSRGSFINPKKVEGIFRCMIDETELKLEINKVADRSDFSIIATYGNTTVLTVLTIKRHVFKSKVMTEDKEETFTFKKALNLLDNDRNLEDLRVNFKINAFCNNKIPFNAFRREGSPTDYEKLAARFIDKAIRGFLDFSKLDSDKSLEINFDNEVLAFKTTKYSKDPKIVATWSCLLICYILDEINCKEVETENNKNQIDKKVISAWNICLIKAKEGFKNNKISEAFNSIELQDTEIINNSIHDEEDLVASITLVSSESGELVTIESISDRINNINFLNLVKQCCLNLRSVLSFFKKTKTFYFKTLKDNEDISFEENSIKNLEIKKYEEYIESEYYSEKNLRLEREREILKDLDLKLKNMKEKLLRVYDIDVENILNMKLDEFSLDYQIKTDKNGESRILINELKIESMVEMEKYKMLVERSKAIQERINAIIQELENNNNSTKDITFKIGEDIEEKELESNLFITFLEKFRKIFIDNSISKIKRVLLSNLNLSEKENLLCHYRTLVFKELVKDNWNFIINTCKNIENFINETKKLWNYCVKKVMDDIVTNDNRRSDGRLPQDIRSFNAQSNLLQSEDNINAFFKRGETEVLSNATVGRVGDAILTNNYLSRGLIKKSFIHHYEFPGFSVNEIHSKFYTSRREIGHGALVENSFSLTVRNFLNKLQSYSLLGLQTIKVTSKTLSSNGSSSQASVCATSLCIKTIFDFWSKHSNVNLQFPFISGISLGLIGKKIITDISGLEDKYSDMDLKISGTKEGICSVQLDTKNYINVTLDILEKGLEQSRLSRIKIIEELESAYNKNNIKYNRSSFIKN